MDGIKLEDGRVLKNMMLIGESFYIYAKFSNPEIPVWVPLDSINAHIKKATLDGKKMDDMEKSINKLVAENERIKEIETE